MVLDFLMNNITFFVFILVLAVFLYLKRKNLELQGPFPFLYMLLYKTKWGLRSMNSWSKKHPRLFLYLSFLSVFVGIFGLFFILFFMVWQLGFIIDNNITSGGGLVLPIKTEQGLEGAVPIFYVPFWYWIVALFILAVVHEFAHGVIAERFKIRIKSSGFAFLGILAPIIPAAFVEPDQKQMEKKPRWQQIAVLGAGSTSNFLFGILFLLVWIFLAGPFIDNTMKVSEMSFSQVLNDSSLNDFNITSGYIVAFDGEEDKSLILEKFQSLRPDSTHNITLQTSAGLATYNITTFPNQFDNSRGMIGVSGLNIELGNKQGFEFLGDIPLHFERLIFYIWFLNIAIGLINLLPIWITDGGQIFRVAASGIFKKQKTWMMLYNLVSIFSLILIIFTIWPELMINVLTSFNII